jgi:hypothetical protein
MREKSLLSIFHQLESISCVIPFSPLHSFSPPPPPANRFLPPFILIRLLMPLTRPL